MFNAPIIFSNIPDIAKIYEINDKQCDDLEKAVDELDGNIFLDYMNEHMISNWENLLNITPLDDDTVDERRFRVKSKVIERLPYSIRMIKRKLDTLCPDGYTLALNDQLTEANIKIALKSSKMIDDVAELMEDMLPLNMIFKVTIIWNQYGTLTQLKHSQLATLTYKEVREVVLENENNN